MWQQSWIWNECQSALIIKLDVAEEQYLQVFCLPCLFSWNNKIYDRPTFINQIIYRDRYPLGFFQIAQCGCVPWLPVFGQSALLLLSPRICLLLWHDKWFFVIIPFEFDFNHNSHRHHRACIFLKIPLPPTRLSAVRIVSFLYLYIYINLE